jgi:hypothetical protein
MVFNLNVSPLASALKRERMPPKAGLSRRGCHARSKLIARVEPNKVIGGLANVLHESKRP